MAVRWTGNLEANLKQVGPRARKFLSETMQYHAPRAETYMRNNAPWTDRTSNARNSLVARAVTEGDVFQIVCSHGVPYGIWLEVRWGGRYAIMPQTVETQGRETFETASKIMARLAG